MWRKTSRPQVLKVSTHRWRLVVAFIFLLSGALLYKLFSLQVKNFDLYVAMASGQQQVASQLRPERGLIYFTETINGQERLYPVATNKTFATLYAIPKDITAPQELAEKLYNYFDRERVEKTQVALNNSQGSSTTNLFPGVDDSGSSSVSELSEIETAIRGQDFVIDTVLNLDATLSGPKADIISAYLKRLDKPGDPYEPLEGKVLGLEALLNFFAWMVSTPEHQVKATDLEIKNGQVFYKKNFQEGESELAGRAIKIDGLGFELSNRRYYPENEIASHLLGFVSYGDGDGGGRYGLEEFFNTELFGEYGFLKSERGGRSDVIIVNDREYVKPEDGSDLVLTVDRNVQFFACAKLRETVKKHSAKAGNLIVVNPHTGAIIAMCSVPDFDPNNFGAVKDISVYNNPALLYQYEPGSVFKIVTMAIAINEGKVSPSTTYRDEGQIMVKGWSRPIRNSDFSTHGAHGVVDMNRVLDMSLNTGAIFAMSQVGPKVFAEYVKNFGFGERSGLELGAESPGNIGNLLVNRVKDIDAATASFGQGIAVTPLQMAMSYQIIANNGLLMKPYIVKAIIRGEEREEIKPKEVRQVVSPKTAATVLAMLANVVEKGHSHRAAIDGYYVGGKTGTAQVAERGGYSSDKYIHTFIGVAPIDNPAFVMLVKIDEPQGVRFAEGSALPLWREVADYMLKYYQIPKTR